MKQAVLRILEMRVVEVRFQYIREWGLCFRKDREVVIRSSLCERSQIRTLIHEHIHYLRPQWDEVRVLESEEAVFGGLSEDEYQVFKEHLDFWKEQ